MSEGQESHGCSLTGWDVHQGKRIPVVGDNAVPLTAPEAFTGPQETTVMVMPHLDRPGYEQSPALHGPSLSSLLENLEGLAPLP